MLLLSIPLHHSTMHDTQSTLLHKRTTTLQVIGRNIPLEVQAKDIKFMVTRSTSASTPAECYSQPYAHMPC